MIMSNLVFVVLSCGLLITLGATEVSVWDHIQLVIWCLLCSPVDCSLHLAPQTDRGECLRPHSTCNLVFVVLSCGLLITLGATEASVWDHIQLVIWCLLCSPVDCSLHLAPQTDRGECLRPHSTCNLVFVVLSCGLLITLGATEVSVWDHIQLVIWCLLCALLWTSHYTWRHRGECLRPHSTCNLVFVVLSCGLLITLGATEEVSVWDYIQLVIWCLLRSPVDFSLHLAPQRWVFETTFNL